MTDRLAGFLVVLEEDVREDDAAATLAAIQQIKGVLSVKPVVANVELAIAEARVHRQFSERVWEALRVS